jgi:hypothetical protein
MESKGQFWPLYVVFITTVIGGAIGLLHPQTFGQPSSDLTVGSVLGSVALVMAIAFAVPIGLGYALVPWRLGAVGQPNRDSVLGRLRALQWAIGEDQAQTDDNRLLGRLRALQQAIGANQAEPDANSLSGRLRALQQAIGEHQAQPNPNSVLGRLRAFQVAIGEEPMQPPEGTLLHRLEQLRVAINDLKDAVETAAQIQAGTVLSRLGPPAGAGVDNAG